jgi:copper chaperone CopZ
MKVEGIKSVKATFTDGKALVEYDASQADTSEIRAAITGAGYRVSAFSGLTTSETQK